MLSVPGLHPPSSSHGLLGGRIFLAGWVAFSGGEKGLFRLSWIFPPPKCGVYAAGKCGGTAGPGDALPRDTTLTLILETLQTVPAKAPESRLTAELLAPSPDGLLGSEEGCERSPLYLHYQECTKQGGAGWGGGYWLIVPRIPLSETLPALLVSLDIWLALGDESEA